MDSLLYPGSERYIGVKAKFMTTFDTYTNKAVDEILRVQRKTFMLAELEQRKRNEMCSYK